MCIRDRHGGVLVAEEISHILQPHAAVDEERGRSVPQLVGANRDYFSETTEPIDCPPEVGRVEGSTDFTCKYEPVLLPHRRCLLGGTLLASMIPEGILHDYRQSLYPVGVSLSAPDLHYAAGQHLSALSDR